MVPDTASIVGYTIYREEPNDAAPDFLKQRTTHPLDHLSIDELRAAATLIRDQAGSEKTIKLNCLTLREPVKKGCAAFSYRNDPLPDRRAFAIVLERETARVSEIIANLTLSKVETWTPVSDVAPTLTLEDLYICERVARADPRVAEAREEILLENSSRWH